MRVLRSKVVAGAAVALASVLGTPTVADADVAPPAQVRSNFENYYGAKLVRDCGYSEPVPGNASQSFWLFCDTAVHDWAGNLTNFIAGTTAARGPATRGLVPQGLTEMTRPPAPLPTMPSNVGPAQFLPTPTGVLNRNGTACQNQYDGSGRLTEAQYPASWASGMATIPGTTRYLITYRDVCVQAGWVFTIKRFGMVEYTPSSNTLSNDRKVFSVGGGASLPVQQQLGSPVFYGTDLHLYTSVCDATSLGACTTGRIFQARVPSAQRTTASSYRWRNGTNWVSTPGSATSIVNGARPVEVHVDDYGSVGRGIVIAESTSIGGHYRLWRATNPTATYTASVERQLPGCTPPSGVTDICHAFVGHPDLSTTSNAALTYYAVEDQHVRMAVAPW